MAELADAADLKSAGRDTLWVQVPPALQKSIKKGRYLPAIFLWFGHLLLPLINVSFIIEVEKAILPEKDCKNVFKN